MQKEIIFKQCSEEDVASLSEIGAKTFEETFAAENSKEDMEEYLQKDFNTEKILSEVQNPDSVFMLAQVKENRSLMPMGYMKVNFGSAQTENAMTIQWRFSGLMSQSPARDFALGVTLWSMPLNWQKNDVLNMSGSAYGNTITRQ